MRLVYALLYPVQWLFYLIRLVLSVVYGLLVFISKPGSPPIVLSVAAVVLFLLREGLYPQAQGLLRAIDYRSVPEPWLLDGLLGIAFIPAACAYVILSRMLAVVLGTFPPIIRPLPPMRRLNVSRRSMKPVVVRLVVPRLRRRWL